MANRNETIEINVQTSGAVSNVDTLNKSAKNAATAIKNTNGKVDLNTSNAVKNLENLNKSAKNVSGSLGSTIATIDKARGSVNSLGSALGTTGTIGQTFSALLPIMTGGVKGLNAALSANPLSAIITGITTIIALTKVVMNLFKKSKEQSEDQKKVLEQEAAARQKVIEKLDDQKQKYSELNDAIELQAHTMRVNGASNIEVLEMEREELSKLIELETKRGNLDAANELRVKYNEKNLQLIKEQRNAEIKEAERARDAELKMIEDKRIANEKAYENAKRAREIAAQEALKLYQDTVNNISQNLNRILSETITHQQRLNQALATDAMTTLTDTQNILIQQIEQIKSEIENADGAELEALQIHLQQINELYEKNQWDIHYKQIEIERIAEEKRIADAEKEMERLELEKQKQLEEQEKWEQKMTELRTIYGQKRVEELNKIRQLEGIEAQKQALFQMELDKQVADHSLAISGDLVNSLGTLMGEHNDVYKGLAVAQTSIETLKSATSAFSSMSAIPVVGPALGIAASAAAIAAGMANVKKILSVEAPQKKGGSAPPAINVTPPAPPEIPPLPDFIDQTQGVQIEGFDVDAVNSMQPVLVVNDLKECENSNKITAINSNF